MRASWRKGAKVLWLEDNGRRETVRWSMWVAFGYWGRERRDTNFWKGRNRPGHAQYIGNINDLNYGLKQGREMVKFKPSSSLWGIPLYFYNNVLFWLSQSGYFSVAGSQWSWTEFRSSFAYTFWYWHWVGPNFFVLGPVLFCCLNIA